MIYDYRHENNIVTNVETAETFSCKGLMPKTIAF